MYQHTKQNGEQNFHGCEERDFRDCPVGSDEFPVFGEFDGSPELLTDEEIESYKPKGLLKKQVKFIKNQNPQSSCCGCAAIQGAMVCRKVYGQDDVELSQAVPYALGNRGRDSGMSIPSGLRALRDYGTVPESYIDGHNWQGYRSRKNKWPSDWQEVAANYKVIEAWDCPSWEHLVTAIILGFPVVLGVDWNDRIGAGHAICGVEYYPDVEEIEVANSWGTKRKGNGFDRVKKRTASRGTKKYGAFIPRVMYDPSNDGDF